MSRFAITTNRKQHPYRIRAQDLKDEAFAPYGDIIKPRMSGEQFDRTHSYDPSK